MKAFLIRLYDSCNKHDILTLSAALAFYTAFSLAPLLFSASAVFGQLQTSLNVIWEVVPQKTTQSEIWIWAKKRFFSMGLVLAFAFLSMVSLLANTVITLLFKEMGSLLKAVFFLGSMGIFAYIFFLIFHYLPDRKNSKRGSWIGGVITALLFTVGKSLIGIYLGDSAIGSAYGTAGSLVILLLWVYYSSIIVFLGAELTRGMEDLKLFGWLNFTTVAAKQ